MKKELFELRFKSRTSAGNNPARIRVLKRAIARVHTLRALRARGDAPHSAGPHAPCAARAVRPARADGRQGSARGAEEALNMTSTARHARRTMIGIVGSTKTQKTITVEVERTFKHAKYGKYLR